MRTRVWHFFVSGISRLGILGTRERQKLWFCPVFQRRKELAGLSELRMDISVPTGFYVPGGIQQQMHLGGCKHPKYKEDWEENAALHHAVHNSHTTCTVQVGRVFLYAVVA